MALEEIRPVFSWTVVCRLKKGALERRQSSSPAVAQGPGLITSRERLPLGVTAKLRVTVKGRRKAGTEAGGAREHSPCELKNRDAERLRRALFCSVERSGSGKQVLSMSRFAFEKAPPAVCGGIPSEEGVRVDAGRPRPSG